MPSTIHVEILRQSTPDAPARTERFAIPYRPNMNITSVLGEIALNPITADGAPTTPITYDSNCLEEICGSCAMLINGRARMACSTLVDTLQKEHPGQPIRLAPLSKFPVVRDLAVDRAVLFENLKVVKAWVPIDGTYDLGPGPRQFPQTQEARYPLSNCISCTICMEVCPQFNERPTSSARPPSRRPASSTWTPPAPSSRPTVSAPSPAKAASRSAASPRTASRPAPNCFLSPNPSPSPAAKPCSSSSKTSSPAEVLQAEAAYPRS